MATSFASALTEGQPAQLDLGEEAVPCLVVGFTGADVVLAPSAELPPDALESGFTTYLLIDAGGSLQALKAEVRRAGNDGELVATLLDPFRLGQRRTFSRAPLVLPAHLRPLGTDGPPKTTFTRDISAGGLRIPPPHIRAGARRPGGRPSYEPADAHHVVIGLVQANREIKATAATVRETDSD